MNQQATDSYLEKMLYDRNLAITQLKHVLNSGLAFSIKLKTEVNIRQDPEVEIKSLAEEDVVATLRELCADAADEIKHLKGTLAGVNLALQKEQEKNKELTALLDDATKPQQIIDPVDVIEYDDDATELEKLGDQLSQKHVKRVGDILSKEQDAEIEAAKAAATGPTYIEGLPDDENPYLPRRDPYTRKRGCALQKYEVWQIRRYITSGRSYHFIQKTMNVGSSTISSLKHNVSYRGIAMEQRDSKPVATKPIKVRAGYGVVGKDDK